MSHSIKSCLMALAMVFWCSFLFATPSSQQQELAKTFFTNHASFIAAWAYPTATYKGCNVSVADNKVKLRLDYYSNWTDRNFYLNMVATIDSEGNLERLYVERTTAFLPPFTTMTLLKQALTEILSSEDTSNQEKNAIVKRLKAQWNAMNGKDVCCLILQYYWLDEGYRSQYRKCE